MPVVMVGIGIGVAVSQLLILTIHRGTVVDIRAAAVPLFGDLETSFSECALSRIVAEIGVMGADKDHRDILPDASDQPQRFFKAAGIGVLSCLRLVKAALDIAQRNAAEHIIGAAVYQDEIGLIMVLRRSAHLIGYMTFAAVYSHRCAVDRVVMCGHTVFFRHML